MQGRNRDDCVPHLWPSSPRSWLITTYSYFVGLAGVGLLVYGLVTGEQELRLLPVLVFGALSFLIQRFGFSLGATGVYNLGGAIDLAAVLVLGPIGGALVAVMSGVINLELSAFLRRTDTRRHWVEIPLFSAGLKALVALVAGALYVRLEGPWPLTSLGAETALATGAVCIVWFVVEQLGWGIWAFLDGGQARLRLFLRDTFPHGVLIELLPLPFSVVLALVYTRLGGMAFAMLALLVVIVALLMRRWADARNELLQRVTELATIEQAGWTIAQAQLDVDEICELMYDRASQIADATIFHLGLFEGDEYILKLRVREGRPDPPQSFRLAPGVGLVNWLRESKQPLLVRDFDRELDQLPARPAYVAEDPPRSGLYVPLMAGDLVIGTMSVQSFHRNAYGDSDLRVLSAMASQAALAIQKARLYAKEHERVRQLETIGQVVRQVTATLELNELFQRVVHLVRDSFGYYHVAVYFVDRALATVNYQASASAGGQDVAVDVAWEQGLVGWVAAHGQTVMVNDVQNEPRYRCIEALEETRSELVVPLLLDGQPVGVLDVQSDQLDTFGPDDLFILETLGAQIAIAIQEARLYESERQQAWLSTALLQVADAMSRVSDMDAVLTSIVRLTPILAGVDRCTILLWDADAELFIPAQTHGLTPKLRQTLEEMEFSGGTWPALDLVRWKKAPLLVDATLDAGLVPQSIAETFDIREMVFLPLLAQGELLGVMMVDYAGKAHHFGERIMGMLAGIANQAAMVIQSARLVQAQQEESYVSMALLQVADAVSRSTDLAETLASVVRITPMLVGVEACALFLRDREAAAFLPAQQYGLKGMERVAFGELCLDESDILVRELLKGRPSVDLHVLAEAPTLVSALGRDSLLALPLNAKGEILGTMIVEYGGQGQRFAQRWMNILSGIAGQVAMAIENALLLQEAAEQERMKQELVVAQRIQASFLPECCPSVSGWELAAIWRSARQVSGDFYDFIPLPSSGIGSALDEGRMGLVIADVADKGVPAALLMALSRTLVRTMAIDGKPPATAISRANDLILSDARAGLFVTLFYTIIRPDSGEISYVNAGHMPPLVVRATTGQVEELRVPGIALGILPSIAFQEWHALLEPGDTLILYTDGVTDAADAAEQRFGLGRLKEVVRTHWHLPAVEFAETIQDAVGMFVGGAAQFDDFTLLVAQRNR